jgi:hypothetical protein
LNSDLGGGDGHDDDDVFEVARMMKIKGKNNLESCGGGRRGAVRGVAYFAAQIPGWLCVEYYSLHAWLGVAVPTCVHSNLTIGYRVVVSAAKVTFTLGRSKIKYQSPPHHPFLGPTNGTEHVSPATVPAFVIVLAPPLHLRHFIPILILAARLESQVAHAPMPVCPHVVIECADEKSCGYYHAAGPVMQPSEPQKDLIYNAQAHFQRHDSMRFDESHDGDRSHDKKRTRLSIAKKSDTPPSPHSPQSSPA